ncbi:MAG TPA: sulfotransferase domain-containing protein [Anaerolineae bacterium]|nr:sulfotransferase domain-containing protein [Anaerolineae bacterium]
MYWQKVPLEALRPKYVLNGYPKAGLHLAELMLAPVVLPQPADGLFSDHWVGSFRGHAWTAEWLPTRNICFRLSRLQAGRLVKGHLGHSDEIEQFLYLTGAAVVFVYRDLRDVAVSQTHHILNPDDHQFEHPDKTIYQEMTFDEALSAVIEGLGPYPGVIERWALYAPWLGCEWVLKMPFERMREGPELAAQQLLEYGLRRVSGAIGLEMRLDDAEYARMVETMVAAAAQRQLSPTYRKGQVGGWRDVFTEQHKVLFKAHDGEGWLVQLGYESDEEW